MCGIAFLSSLRSNLHLSASFPASPISSLPSTPTTAAFSHANLPTYIPSSNPPQRSNHRAFNICQPSWSRIAFVPNGKLPTSHPTSDVRFRSLPNDANSGTETDLPSFSYEVAPVGNSKERAASLELIADSVSQQRRTACRAIVLHTPILTSYLVLLLLGLRYLHYTTLLSTCSTTTLIGLLLIKWLTRGYDKHAKEINWAWLLQNNTLNPPHHPHPNIHTHSTSNINAATTNLASSTNNSLPNSNEPIVLIVRSGSTDDDKIIGTAILRYIKRERKSYIRAWTVSYDERGQGIGEGLLEEAVRMTWARGGRGVEFDPEHARTFFLCPRTQFTLLIFPLFPMSSRLLTYSFQPSSKQTTNVSLTRHGYPTSEVSTSKSTPYLTMWNSVLVIVWLPWWPRRGKRREVDKFCFWEVDGKVVMQRLWLQDNKRTGSVMTESKRERERDGKTGRRIQRVRDNEATNTSNDFLRISRNFGWMELE